MTLVNYVCNHDNMAKAWVSLVYLSYLIYLFTIAKFLCITAILLKKSDLLKN